VLRRERSSDRVDGKQRWIYRRGLPEGGGAHPAQVSAGGWVRRARGQHISLHIAHVNIWDVNRQRIAGESLHVSFNACTSSESMLW
jgi:hypothetical protein